MASSVLALHPASSATTCVRACCLLRRTGTLLIIDETHTISAGPGGCTQLEGLQPDMLVIGKPIAGAGSSSTCI